LDANEPVFYTENSMIILSVPVLPEFLSAMSLPQVESYQPTGAWKTLAGISGW
jgi:hypothetical protein